ILGIPQDASGAFRVYRLDRVPRQIFQLVKSTGYAFFLESLYIFNRNRLIIGEVPIILPGRTSGSSKMLVSDALNSISIILELFVTNIRYPGRFLIKKEPAARMSGKNCIRHDN
ncbi:MAG: hypothetical protein WCQ57_09200, partial [Verrucomicrobiota bacterium]